MKFRSLLLTSLVFASCATGEMVYDATPRPVQIDPHHVRVAANENYDRVNGLKKFFFGQHYRTEWGTPVAIEILNLDSLNGKIIPTKMGGGMQTKSLRLKSDDGNEYVLRSVNKDPSKALPKEFVGTFADDVIQDQISSSNPYAPLAVSSLAQSAGVLHAEPKIVFVQKTPALGEFNSDFGNTLCLFEQRPVGNQKFNSAFGNSENIITSEKLFEKLAEDPNHRVDQRAFLNARLFDMWIGDWDRHEDQWVWASFKNGNEVVYKPIPRDRDQAFANLDGVIPQIAARKWAVRKTQNFDYTIRDINGLNLNGNYLDRMFTNELNRSEWLAVADSLNEKLTDERIEQAFQQLPPEIFAISGEQTISKLKQRRNDLRAYALEYYLFLSKEVTVIGSDKKDRFLVKRRFDSTEVTVIRKSQSDTANFFFHRIFLNDETKEIRLYGLAASDKFELTGESKSGALIRIISGDGKDSLINHSSVAGLSKKTKVYDKTAPSVDGNADTRMIISNDTLKNEFQRKSFRYDVLAPILMPGYNQDDGVYVGGGVSFKKFQFGKSPFGMKQSVWGNYAASTGASNFRYDACFTDALGPWDLAFTVKVNAPNFTFNYYGMGNETRIVENNWSYHRIRLNQIIIMPTIQRHVGKHNELTFGLSYQRIRLQHNDNRFIGTPESGIDSTHYSSKHYAGARVSWEYSTRNRTFYPTKGIYSKLEAEHTYQSSESESTAIFTRFNAQVSGYKTYGHLTLAGRVGGSVITNDSYNFYQAATLGGMDNLRGYRRTRYSGQYTAYVNTDIRVPLGQSRGYFLRGTYGVMAFYDVGRVWVKNDVSNQWHKGYGAGLWFLPYYKMTITATYEMSGESNLFNIRTGFTF